jgi:hypothetical protein
MGRLGSLDLEGSEELFMGFGHGGRAGDGPDSFGP